MAEGPLQPALDRFGRIEPAHFVAAYLLGAKRPRSAAQLQANLRKWAAAPVITQAIAVGMQRGHLQIHDDRVEVTEAGRQSTRECLGEDADAPRDRLLERRFPIAALGLDPDDAEVRRRLAGNQELVGAIVAVGYGLPASTRLSIKHTCSELVWRSLRPTLSDLIGSGPFPLVEESDVVGGVILSGLAGVSGAPLNQVFKALAAKALMVSSSQMEVLRQRLVQVALLLGLELNPLFTAPLTDDQEFAARIRETAVNLETPPFRGRVAIAQVYDAFGADCGSLEHFKGRLIDAAKERLLDLSSLDMPEYMSAELRDRSATPWGEEWMHFVVSEWK